MNAIALLSSLFDLFSFLGLLSSLSDLPPSALSYRLDASQKQTVPLLRLKVEVLSAC
jgi:hypothetical protein